MDGLLKIVAPFLYLYASTACLGDLLLLSINLRYTRTVNVVFYCIVAVLLQLPDTWASCVGFYSLLIMDFLPALTSILSKWLHTCSTLYWKVPLFHMTSSATFQVSIVFILFCSLSVHFYSRANNSSNSLLTMWFFFLSETKNHSWLAIFLLTG